MWLALDEQERITLIERFHRSERTKLPNIKVHATFHVIVENQIAERHEAVVRAMERLQGQALSRHESLHAIAWVLSQGVFEALKGSGLEVQSDLQTEYTAAVERLDAKSWLAQGQ